LTTRLPETSYFPVPFSESTKPLVAEPPRFEEPDSMKERSSWCYNGSFHQFLFNTQEDH